MTASTKPPALPRGWRGPARYRASPAAGAPNGWFCASPLILMALLLAGSALTFGAYSAFGPKGQPSEGAPADAAER